MECQEQIAFAFFCEVLAAQRTVKKSVVASGLHSGGLEGFLRIFSGTGLFVSTICCVKLLVGEYHLTLIWKQLDRVYDAYYTRWSMVKLHLETYEFAASRSLLVVIRIAIGVSLFRNCISRLLQRSHAALVASL